MTTVVKNPHNNQEVFDFVVNALRKQGCQSTTGDGCLYRGPNNTRCAAGHLIPDEDYKPGWEAQSLYFGLPIIDSMSPIGKYLHNQGYCTHLVFDLQKVHDNLWEHREEEWQKVATNYGLNYTPPSVS